jgi:tryptophanyl-tRNA synthetase
MPEKTRSNMEMEMNIDSAGQRRARVLSGIQPSGILHLGNYLGALRRWVLQQEAKENYFCIVDMHAITETPDPKQLHRRTLEAAAVYLAAGLDPEKSTIFVQSYVRAHAECCWILNCVTPIGWLERMTQFKAKANQRGSVSAALLDYPVLQAADILLYDADEVPVGEDQRQHIELTRDIAQRFNHLYGKTFILPKPVIPESGARIRAFNDPAKKMSKTEAHIRGHAVNLIDKPDEIRRVISRAVTDSGNEILFTDDPDKAGINNLLEIYELLTELTRPAIERHFAGKGYGALKRDVAEAVIDTLRPIRERYETLMKDTSTLGEILRRGAERASAIAEAKVQEVKRKVGFIVC